MKIKKFVFAALLLFVLLQTSAQTLFTYGMHAVSKDEFLKAYNKNPDTTGNRQQKLKDYLNLYINFRLKLQAAYDEHADNNADLKNETDNFKKQLTDNFINQQADVSKLLHEAFTRSQKDILLQQVFVPFEGVDTITAFEQITKAYKALKSGKSIDEVAQQFSTDSATKSLKGMVGYITAFTLPYSIENVVYAVSPGNFSAIYKGNFGYHIFKNVSERPALGRKKIQQLLFSAPAFFSSDQINQTKKTADSVFNLLQNGSAFESFLPVYGKNYQSFDASANIEIKVGDYNTDFENEVFELKNAGDYSKPFKTSYGWNIIKLIENEPVSKDENDVVFTAYRQTQIQNDGRLDVAKSNLVQKWLTEVNYSASSYNKKDLWNYTDSALQADSLPQKIKTVKAATVLFQFQKQKYTVTDWITYLKSNKPSEPTNLFDQPMQDFINSMCNIYYREHIVEFDPALKEQLKEFNDANMLFYVMDKHVWNKASSNSVGLKAFYNKHADNYKWDKSVSAIVVSGADATTINEAAKKIKSDATNWRKTVSAFGNTVYADSSRFEVNQLPVKQPLQLQKDFQTIPEQNEAKDAYSFVHVFNVYSQAENRSFDDAKGLVINDYQEELEKDWVNKLKKKYPVKVNEAVFNNSK